MGDPSRPDRSTQTAAGEPTEATPEKHEKVLHTRISPTLDREIKRRARNLGMSVSTIVRHVLLNTFDLVEDIVNDSAGVAASIAGETAVPPTRADSAAQPGPSAGGEVIAWQEAVLNLNAVCARCNTILAVGTNAAVGLRDAPGPRAIICTQCLAALGGRGDDGDSEGGLG